MNVQEITKQLYAIGAAIFDKTGSSPWTGPVLTICDNQCEVSVYRDYGVGIQHYKLGNAKGDTPEEAIAAAWAVIAALPDPATFALRNHMGRVAEVADKARADGIDEAYIKPLSVVVQAISNNLLAAPVQP